MARVLLNNVTKRFGNVIAVNSLSLEVKDKEFLVLLGPSGCGKTTTLNMIAGLLNPTSGKIFVGDTDMTGMPPLDRNVGLVFQNYAVFGHMTVYDNLAFGLKVRKLPKDEINAEVKKVAELLELTDILKKKAGGLRLDEMQKTALARSMVTKPAFFLLDEPLSNLDATLRSFMRVELKRIQRELKQTILYVTHDQIEAMSMADRIAVMNLGRLQQYGTRSEVYDQPANKFVANFIGSPSMNLIDCSLLEKGGKAFLDTGEFQIDVTKLKGTIKKDATSSELTMGIRPEHMNVSRGKLNKDSFESAVVMAEPLGSETILHLKMNKIPFNAVVPPTFEARFGDKVRVLFNKEKLYILDKKTEKVIV
ncbi:ABC transporter ATP-binding protein [Candidatus Pacearchaeota archaeon]|nr:ABC transporter ATP-binding protein [Candidatus Pacearchaeota archaeon]